MLAKIDSMQDLFQFFMNGEWVFVNNRIYSIVNCLSDEEKEDFCCDVQKIVWIDFIRDYCIGIHTWVLNQNMIDTEAGLDQVILRNYNRFETLKIAMNSH